MIENTSNGRSTINFDGLRMKIQIPSKKNWFIIIFLIVWIGGWFMGERSAMSEVLNSENIADNSFILIWLIGWTLGGGFAIAVLLWSLLGLETITIDNHIFQIEKGILDFRILSKKYELSSIKRLKLNEEQTMFNHFNQMKVADFWGLTGGKLRFDYGMKTIKFGIGIDEAEARFVIDEIVKNGYYKLDD
jgi:hypothetical protein